LLRFLSELALVHVINPVDLVSFYETLLSVLDDPTPDVHKCDVIVYSVLACLPYVGHLLAQEATHIDFTKILARISTYMKSRSTMKVQSKIDIASSGLSIYRSNNFYYDQVDPLEMIWSQIHTLESDQWDVSIYSL
jgi:hypothetical protein